MRSFTIMFFLLFSGLVSLTVSADSLRQSDALKLVDSGDILPLEEILKLFPELKAGRVLDLELEQEDDGYFIYEIEVLMRDGSVREYEVDASNGHLLREEFEE